MTDIRLILYLLSIIAASACLQKYAISADSAIEYYQAGDIETAIFAARETLAEYEKEDTKSQNTATALENLASLLIASGQYSEAKSLLEKSKSIRVIDSVEYAMTLVDIADLEHVSGNIDLAEKTFEEALNILDLQDNVDPMFWANSKYIYSEILLKKGKANSAVKQLNDALKLLKDARSKTTGQNTTLISAILIQLSRLSRNQGNINRAEKYLLEALDVQKKNLSDDHFSIAITLNNLAEINVQTGRYNNAKSYYIEALGILNKDYAQNAVPIAVLLSNYSELEYQKGEFESAVKLINQALTIQEKAYGDASVEIAPVLSRLAGMHYSAEQYDKSLALTKKIVSIYEKKLPDSYEYISSLTNLAEIYRKVNQHRKAEELYRKTIELTTTNIGHNNILMTNILSNRAALYKQQNKVKEAIKDYKQAEQLITELLGIESIQMLDVSYGLGETLYLAGETSAALDAYRTSKNIIKSRYLSDSKVDANTRIKNVRQQREILEKYLSILANQEQSESNIDESYQTAQLAHASSTAYATNQMAIRFATGNDKLMKLIRSREKLKDQVQEFEKDFISTSTQTTNSKASRDIKVEILKIKKQLKIIDTELSKNFPKYFDLSNISSLTIDETQSLLDPSESLVVYLVSKRYTFAWVINSQISKFYKMEIGRSQLTRLVDDLRKTVDPTHLHNFKYFSKTPSYQLYKNIFQPFENDLKNTDKIILVPDGALSTIPFELLVSLDSPEIMEISKLPFLIKKFAFSYLPSSGSLRALRNFAGKSKSSKKFLGIGNPMLLNTQRFENAKPVAENKAISVSREISQLSQLPETEQELNSISKIYKPQEVDLLLGDSASEKIIKHQTSLDDYQIISFATHGLMAGQLKHSNEPGLVLTPPKQPSGENDGYLSASEIAQLKLNSDWVLLSACNTAASDGNVESESWSGLTRAFFYAGSRSMLVSHWAVWSEATVNLITDTMINYTKSPDLGRARAHQQSIIEMLKNSRFSHPVAWAPFIVVGDGN